MPTSETRPSSKPPSIDTQGKQKRYGLIALLLFFGLFTAVWLDNVLQALLYNAFTRPQNYSFSDWMHVLLRLALAWGVGIILLLPVLLIAKLKRISRRRK